MGSFSDYLENELIDHVFKTGAYTAATNLYVGLSHTTWAGATADAYTGTTAAHEINTNGTTGGYIRKKCNTWDLASAGATENSQAVTFAQATANWGTVRSWFVADKTTKGNIIVWGTLTTAKAVSSGDTLKFATGDIDITLS